MLDCWYVRRDRFVLVLMNALCYKGKVLRPTLQKKVSTQRWPVPVPVPHPTGTFVRNIVPRYSRKLLIIKPVWIRLQSNNIAWNSSNYDVTERKCIERVGIDGQNNQKTICTV